MRRPFRSRGPGQPHRPLSLRVRLSLAFVGMAALAVGLAALLSVQGFEPKLSEAHVTAGAIAVAVALLVALVLAQTMSAPLRRIRATAERMERGDLQAKVDIGGDAEVQALGHALNRLAMTLEHEEQLRRASVADLAHELRTPVSGLLSRIEAAQDGVLADEEGNLAAMHAEAMRLKRLLDDLDKLAAAEQPGLLLEKRRLDLAGVASSEASQMAAGFEEKGVQLDCELSEAPIVGDPDRLAQIVVNLLSNALRYTEPGGRVCLRVRVEDRKAILEVSDTGVGIAAGDLPQIFKRFWRADKSRSRSTGGAGIGLAIVRELVTAHDGRIDVESEHGKGSTFRVCFDLAAAKPGGQHRRAARPSTVSR